MGTRSWGRSPKFPIDNGPTPCTYNNREGICLHESACDGEHLIWEGGVVDDINFRSGKQCNPDQWCCIKATIPDRQLTDEQTTERKTTDAQTTDRQTTTIRTTDRQTTDEQPIEKTTTDRKTTDWWTSINQATPTGSQATSDWWTSITQATPTGSQATSDWWTSITQATPNGSQATSDWWTSITQATPTGSQTTSDWWPSITQATPTGSQTTSDWWTSITQATPTGSQTTDWWTSFNQATPTGSQTTDEQTTDRQTITIRSTDKQTTDRPTTDSKTTNRWARNDQPTATGRQTTQQPDPPIDVANENKNCLALEGDVCPWCVLLYLSDGAGGQISQNPFCLGALIGSKAIITASTCLITAVNKTVYVRLPNSSYPGKNYIISQRLFHPDYYTGTRAYDIGLLVVESDVTLHRSQGACLDLLGPFEGDIICVGYGFDINWQIYSTILKVKDKSCGKAGNTEDAACGTNADAVCLVDLGAPILCPSVGNRLVLRGIARGRCDSNDQMLLGGIAHSDTWIEKELASMNIPRDSYILS
nr:uncharacterized protein LOC117983990 [Maniola hyperantus]